MHPWMERQIAPVRPGDALAIFAYLPPCMEIQFVQFLVESSIDHNKMSVTENIKMKEELP
jgi:hypothetical protein